MPKPVLLIVLSQLLGTSLWFSANSVSQSLSHEWGLSLTALGYLTLSVQAGFISGTLLLSLSGIADMYRASWIFATSAVAGAICNAGLAATTHLGTALALRFATGLALAGIYPLGMKLIVSWVPNGAGGALGWLVGMLTLGTALPHLIRGVGTHWPWQGIVLVSSSLALVAGITIAYLGDGPHLPTARRSIAMAGVVRAFRNPDFRSSAFGYFGHMWELYAFWTIVPSLVGTLIPVTPGKPTVVAFASFLIIAGGAGGCILGGRLSRRFGSARVALLSLAASGLICFVYPLVASLPIPLRGTMLLLWGIFVVADSPQFSALSALAAPIESVGAALTIQNSVGFLVTIPAIALVTSTWSAVGSYVAWILLPGPIVGIVSLLAAPSNTSLSTRDSLH